MPWKPQHPDDFPSLGWQVLDWWADHLPSPRDKDAEFILTESQARQIIEWFRVDPQSGRLVYRRGYSRRSKGRGKSPIEAAKAIAEFAGPVRFDGWDANGQPVGRPWGTADDPRPYVQVAAVSAGQTDNTWSVVYYFLTENDGSAADALGIDAGLTRCYLRGVPGAKLEPVTAEAGSREGQPLTYAVMDETHLWTPSNGGTRLAKTLRRNVAKMGGRSYETTNSFMPGEKSVAEGSHKSVQLGAAGVLADEIEAPRVIDGVPVDLDAPDSVLRAALEVAYGSDTWWVDLDRLVQDIRDPEQPWDESCRFYFNWNQKGGGSAVDPHKWTDLADPRDVPTGARIGVGFDGSISHDSTGIVGCTDDGYLFVIGAWERPRDVTGRKAAEWTVPRLEVAQKVAETFDRYSVGRFFGDPPKWATELEQWADTYRNDAGKTVEERERVLAFDTNQWSKFSLAVDRFLTAVRTGSLSHADDETLNAHVLAATLQKVRSRADSDDDRTRYVFVKPDDGRKIDLAIAAVLAHEAAMTMPEEATASADPFVVYA